MNNSVVCSTFNVRCSWDGLLGERNCSCVWSFWCSELCSVNQTVTVQRGSVLDVRGPEWFYQPFCSLWISTVLGVGRVVPMIRSAVRTTLWSQIWLLSRTRQLLTCRGRIQWWQSRTVSAFFQIIYSSQHLKWIKKVHQSCPKTRTHFGFRTTLMKGFDPVQMLTSVYKQ